MVFKWKVTKPSFAQAVNGVELKAVAIECEFETGCAKEALCILQDDDDVFKAIFGFSPLDKVDFGAAGEGVGQAPPAANDEVPAKKERKPRTPKVEAIAPEPIPVPDAPPLVLAPPLVPAPSSAALAVPALIPPPTGGVLAVRDQNVLIPAPNATVGQIDPAMPAFLDRTAAAPPPPLPAAPVALAPPPVGVHGPAVVFALQARAKDALDKGQALADWLADCGLTIKGANFDDACRAVLMISDDKLTASGVLSQLGL